MKMVRRRYIFLLVAAAAVLSSVLFWRMSRPALPLSREAQGAIIRQMAEQPESWRGWKLLHHPDAGWTDARQGTGPVQPIGQPLSPAEPFFLVDGSQSLTPTEAARQAIYSMLHYIRANRAGDGYELLDFRVEAPRLLGREDILERALEHCGTAALNKRTPEQIRAWCRGFFQRYPGLGAEMWAVEPAFSLKWSGEISSVSYQACVNSGLADGEGFVDLPRLFRYPARSSPLLLIRQGNQYRLQHAEAFFAQYEGETAQPSRPPEHTERT